MPSRVTQDTLPSAREFVNGAFKDRRIIISVVVVTNLLFGLLAVSTTPKYQSSAALIVLPSVDYAPRSDPGVLAPNDASLSREEILPTEVQILGGPALHAEVIRQIGLINLYPNLLRPPSLIHKIIGAPKRAIHALIALFQTHEPAKPPVDPVRQAVPLFDADLTLVAQKEGSIIEISFRSKYPEMSALVVNTLVKLYLSERHGLYADVQAAEIDRQMRSTDLALEAIEQKIAALKLHNGVYDFSQQQTNLLGEQGDLQRQLDGANIAKAEAASRIAEFDAEQKKMPVNVVQYTESDYDSRTDVLRATMNNLMGQENALLTQFTANSQPVAAVHTQIDMIKKELKDAKNDHSLSLERDGRNLTYDAVDTDLLGARADLSAAEARLRASNMQLAQLTVRLNELSANEAAVDDLQRQRAATESGYDELVKQYDEVREMEQIDQHKAGNIRMIEPAVVPLKASSLTFVLLVIGVFVSVLAGFMSTVISELRRPGLISPEKLERSLGLRVLVSIPEYAHLAAAR